MRTYIRCDVSHAHALKVHAHLYVSYVEKQDVTLDGKARLER